MKERPILFSGEMVRAILEGRKTMTRRVIKPQPIPIGDDGRRTTYAWRDGLYALQFYPNNSDILAHCPYGQPGDRLWVRETWGTTDADHPRCKGGRKPQKGDRLFYAADEGSAYQWRNGEIPWRPSIFMPRWASRILLEVVSVRVERAQEISGQNCVDEGIDPLFGKKRFYSPTKTIRLCREAFRDLWDSINAKRGYSWDANPWVWVIEFSKK